MLSTKTLTASLAVAGAIAAPAASAMPASDPIHVSPRSAAIAQAPTTDNGFDWGDAGIGAGGAAVVVLLALGGVAALRNRDVELSRPG